MKKLYELLRLNPAKGLFGVEIECEGENISPNVPDTWNIVPDGSLRGVFPEECCEFVMKKPLNYKGTLGALQDLIASQGAASFDFSFRTSTHVHVNCQDMTWGQYCSFLYTSLLMENVLSRFCGDSRINNRFCLRVLDAEASVEVISYLFRHGPRALRDVPEGDVRYSFINYAATIKYGSLEFRGMRGTLDYRVLSSWLAALGNMRKFAMSFDDPRAVHDLFVRANPIEIVKLVLGSVSDLFITEESVGDMRTAFSLTLELPHNYIPLKEEKKDVLGAAALQRAFGEPYILVGL